MEMIQTGYGHGQPRAFCGDILWHSMICDSYNKRVI